MLGVFVSRPKSSASANSAIPAWTHFILRRPKAGNSLSALRCPNVGKMKGSVKRIHSPKPLGPEQAPAASSGTLPDVDLPSRRIPDHPGRGFRLCYNPRHARQQVACKKNQTPAL